MLKTPYLTYNGIFNNFYVMQSCRAEQILQLCRTLLSAEMTFWHRELTTKLRGYLYKCKPGSDQSLKICNKTQYFLATKSYSQFKQLRQIYIDYTMKNLYESVAGPCVFCSGHPDSLVCTVKKYYEERKEFLEEKKR